MIPLSLMLKRFAAPGTIEDSEALIHQLRPSSGSHLLSDLVESSVIACRAQAYRQY
jgi:hypothetical protein